jgi:hypothetical protein
MADMTRNGMTCAEFESLMADALDEVLATQGKATFDEHAAACANCGPMYTEAAAGLKWLRMLEEAEPPRHLVHNIMVATTGAETAAVATERKSWRERFVAWAAPWTKPVFKAVWQPRFAMSAAMAFFSVSLLLNAAGIELREVATLDISPSAVRERVAERYNSTAAEIVKYYDNMRLVYEIEALARQIRQSTSEQPAPQPAPPTQPKPQQKPAPTADDGKDSEKQNRYSREHAETILAWRDPAATPLRADGFARSDS